MSVFIFGDVHGDAFALRKAISKARALAGNDVALYSVGDIIDRGSASKEVVEICVGEGVQGLMGNHELWLHEYLSTGNFNEFALHGAMGGKNTLLSYGVSPEDPISKIKDSLREKIPALHEKFILGLPLSRTLEVAGCKYRLTHGGIPKRTGEHTCSLFQELAAHSGVTLTPDEVSANVMSLLEGTQPEAFLWGGAKKTVVFAFPDKSYQVFGHTPWAGGAEISEQGRYIALDTGCGTCPPYKLSGVLLPPEGGRKIL